MPVPSTDLLSAGLARLKGSLDGLPLIATKTTPGAFAGNALGKQAACLCEENGLVRPLRHSGRTAFFTVTPAGDNWLLEHASAQAALHELAHALGQRSQQLADVSSHCQDQRQQLGALRDWIAALLAKPDHDEQSDLPLPGETDILDILRVWEIEQPLKDCTLPELAARLRERQVDLRTGQFHDACRRLLERGRIYVHPWTGPLFEMPEPALAFLAGHEIAYYASLRPQNKDTVGYHCELTVTAVEMERTSP